MSTDTETIIAEMMVENTGTHFLDSGGSPKYNKAGKFIGSEHGYGRNYERNRFVDFSAMPKTELKIDEHDISFKINLYHFLVESLEYDKEVDEMFHNFAKEQGDDHYWLELMNMFCDFVEEAEPETYPISGECTGIYKKGKPISINSYNEANSLSQTIQFVYFENNFEAYVILQVHGGADVRGGYTKPRVFKLTDELSIFNFNRGSIGCTGEDHHPTALAIKEKQTTMFDVEGIDFDNCNKFWKTDDAYSWYEDGSCGMNYTELNKMEKKNLEEDDEWEPGKLCFKDGVGYCPVCGARLGSNMM